MYKTTDMCMKEIGSEFECSVDNIKENNELKFDGIFVYSGRAAIYNLLKYLLEIRNVDIVWLPSYCCDSMIEPIKSLNVKYDFYAVNYNGKYVERTPISVSKNDIVISLSYFGFSDKDNEAFIGDLKKQGTLIIEDCTHSLLSNNKREGDYIFASLRKWFPIASGGVISGSIEHNNLNLLPPDRDVIEIRKNAMEEKAAYLKEKSTDKDSFLNKYNSFNKSFVGNYNWEIDDWSYELLKKQDIESIIKKRLINAKTLIDGLAKNKNIVIPFKLNDKNDCPLFLPILAKKRSQLHLHLIRNGVYCPIHWPKPNERGAVSNLYENELSIICDQRYTVKDMERIVTLINAFYEEY